MNINKNINDVGKANELHYYLPHELALQRNSDVIIILLWNT